MIAAKKYINPHGWWSDHDTVIASPVASSPGGSQSWGLWARPGRAWKTTSGSTNFYSQGGKYMLFSSRPLEGWNELADYARRKLGIIGWRRMVVNGMAFWIPDNDSDQRPCSESVYRSFGRSGSFAPCDKIALADGVCKGHARHRQRAAEKDAAWRAEIAEANTANHRNRENERAAQDYCARLRVYGIEAVPALAKTKHGVVYTGAVGIQGETTMQLVEQLVMVRRELGIPYDGGSILEVPL